MIEFFDGAAKAWVEGVEFEDAAMEQVRKVTTLPFVNFPVAVMPDVHWGVGATIGSVIPTFEAIIPAAVGVDIGCGMTAVNTGLKSEHLPDSLQAMRDSIEDAVPVGFNQHAVKLKAIKDGSMLRGLSHIMGKHPDIKKRIKGNPWDKTLLQAGTLGGGNHFIEICLDENEQVWIMLHSGSRGIGNILGNYFIRLAKKDMEIHIKNLPDRDLAYFFEGTQYFEDYMYAVRWAQDYARINRGLMMDLVAGVVTEYIPKWNFAEYHQVIVDCHHNYVQKEIIEGVPTYITRKGAVRVTPESYGIIPGSMGERSFIVKGTNNAEAYHSCSHGAGRRMSRKKAKELIDIEEHIEATQGVECRKDAGVLDESPAAYKDIDSVMAAQSDLCEIVHTLKQVLCVKG